jgi:protein arginine kinase activator
VPHNLCQSCQQNPATIHYTEIKDAAKQRELHLCEACAQSQGVSTGPVLASLPPMLASLVKPTKGSQAAAPRCPSCGISFAEFREKGRLGCPNDYQVFREHLDPLLEKIHGASEHKGRLPRGFGPDTDRRNDELLRLRRELQHAVKAEQYETAARLRDEIRKLEAGEPLAASAATPPTPAPRTPRRRRATGKDAPGSGPTPPAGPGEGS